MEFYPHILKVDHLGPIETDEDGFPIIPGPDGLELEGISCREVPNSSGSFVNTDAGEKIIFTSKVYMPLKTENIPGPTEIKIFENDGVTLRMKGRVIRFARFQFNCVLWV